MRSAGIWKDYGISVWIHVALILCLWLLLKPADLNSTRVEVSITPVQSLPTIPVQNSAKKGLIAPQLNLKPSEIEPQSNGSPSSLPSQESEIHYGDALRSQILKHQHYPLFARRHGISGTVQLQIQIDASGRLLQKSVISEGKSPILEKAALGAVEEAAPFQPLPRGISGVFIIPILFHLE